MVSVNVGVSVTVCARHLGLFGEQSHRAFGGSTPHHHLAAGGHQPSRQRAGEVARTQNANDRSAGLRRGGFKMSGAPPFASASD